MSLSVIIPFLVVFGVTIGIALWAGRKSADKAMLYTAGGEISPLQNGLAITGDFVSAGAIFGSVALFYQSGVGMAIYFVAPLVGLCLLLALMAGPLRRLGRFTVGDVLMAKLDSRRLRIFAGLCTLVLSQMYLVAQLVAAGQLFALLLDIPYLVSVVSIGLLVTFYVAYGGMLATTWVQIVKATLLLVGVALMGILSVYQGGGLAGLHARASSAFGGDLGAFASLDMSAFSALSLATGLILGMMGMPHLLIRFLTVADAKAAERSVLLAACLVAMVLGGLLLLVAPAAIAFVKDVPAFESAPGVVRGGANMVFVHLASALGGEILFGIMAAIAFSTILAVVAGLGVAMASTAANDIYRGITRHRDAAAKDRAETRVFRIAAAGAAAIGVGLSIALQDENIAFLSALAFGIAASTNFPILILALYWPRLSATGAIAGGAAGMILSIGLLILGPTVWQKILGNEQALFPSDYSTLVAAPAAFVIAIGVSLLTGGRSSDGKLVAARARSAARPAAADIVRPSK